MLKYLAVTSVMWEDISLEVPEDLISQKIIDVHFADADIINIIDVRRLM